VSSGWFHYNGDGNGLSPEEMAAAEDRFARESGATLATISIAVCEKRTFVAHIGFGGGPYNSEQIQGPMKDYIPRAIAALQEAL
jgi:hypothetical protein